MTQDTAQLIVAVLLIALLGAGVTYAWMKFVDLLLFLTRNRTNTQK
jgi:hypothetical protein